MIQKSMQSETPASAEEILKTEYSEEFDKIRKDMMINSYFVYGKASLNYPSRIDAIASLKKRLEMYDATGNTEYLADVANFAMLEFMRPRKEGAKYTATDRRGSCGVVGLGIAEKVE